ncbi:MAG: RHS repeat-associated core domain-containing protein [Bacteroidales bacterium]|nr:RHS repeat-associated core domain-containing protein [Bacteroidales bacterium]
MPGNKLTSSVNGSDSAAYSYYANGNLKSDSRRDLQFQYNLLNLPSVVTDASGQTVKVRYSYLADGTKLSVRDAQNDGLSYRGSFVYLADGTSSSTAVTEKLESIAHDDGRFVALSASAGATTTQFIDTWHVRDHLGSVRTVLDITRDTSEVSDPTLAILEQNDYLPFGTRIDLDSLAYDQSNRYRFNGKEEQVTGSLGLIDYGARLYDNLLPRWTTPAPLAEKYYSTSPYAFSNNNPVNFVDPDGEFPFLANFVGGFVSAGVEYGSQVIGNIVSNGFSVESFTNVDVFDIGVAFGEGFITSGTNVARRVITKAAVELTGEIARNTVDVQVGYGTDHTPIVNSFGDVIVETAIGVASEAINVDVNISPFKGVSNTKAVRAAKDAANTKGESLSSHAADGVRRRNATLNTEKAAANQAISEGVGSVTGSVVSKVIDEIQDKYRD